MIGCQERLRRFASRSTERILVLDGAMGTMIQRYRLDEADYRGERFATGPATSRATTTSWC